MTLNFFSVFLVDGETEAGHFTQVDESVLGHRLAVEDVPEQFVADFDVDEAGSTRPSANSGWP